MTAVDVEVRVPREAAQLVGRVTFGEGPEQQANGPALSGGMAGRVSANPGTGRFQRGADRYRRRLQGLSAGDEEGPLLKIRVAAMPRTPASGRRPTQKPTEV